MDKKILLLVVENRDAVLFNTARLWLDLWQEKKVTGISFWHTLQRKTIWFMRREMIKKALVDHPDVTHLFFLDTDVFPSMDQLDSLFVHNEDFISGYYCDSSGSPCTRKFGTPFWGKGVMDVDVLSMGFSLMSRKVAETVEYPEPVPAHKIDGDTEFCAKVKEAGFSVKVDFSLKALQMLYGLY